MFHCLEDDSFNLVIVSFCVMRMTTHSKLIVQWQVNLFGHILPPIEWRVTVDVDDGRTFRREEFLEESGDVNDDRISRFRFFLIHLYCHMSMTVRLVVRALIEGKYIYVTRSICEFG
jgi:hypothetical protein